MNGWTWREESETKCVMEKRDKGAYYEFVKDGDAWIATICRARGHDPVTEPVTYDHMMELKAIAEKPD